MCGFTRISDPCSFFRLNSYLNINFISKQLTVASAEYDPFDEDNIKETAATLGRFTENFVLLFGKTIHDLTGLFERGMKRDYERRNQIYDY